MMNTEAFRRHKLLNNVQSALLLFAMTALLATLGWLLAGGAGIIIAISVAVVLVSMGVRISPQMILRMYQARPLPRFEFHELHAAMRTLAQRAQLEFVPRLYYVPSSMINAFAVGDRSSASVAISDGMLRRLSLREIVNVLAHEISHIRHNDMWVMGLADMFSRVTGLLSMSGQFLLILNLPLLLFSQAAISWWVILVLLLAPTISGLIQLALSRAREHDADLGAVELTGDPEGMASALAKIERFQGRFLEQIFFPGRRIPDPSLLRTHPATEDRVRRLREIARSEPEYHEPAWLDASVPASDHALRSFLGSHPRWHINGLWY